MLRLQGVEKSYLYGAKALDDLSFSIDTEERISLLGVSGSGKTTLIKTIAGIVTPEKGRIYLDGRDITDLPPKFRSVKVVYDKEGLFNRRTVAYNLEYPLKIRKYPKKERKIAMLGAAEKYGFPAVTDDYVFRQDDETKLRIALSRLDLYQSSLTLLDNPFSVLTGERRTAVFVELLPKIVSAVKTALFATDSLEEAFSFADNALFLHEGKIVDSGNLKHFIHDPISLYSDTYVNEDRNFIEVPTEDGGIDFYGKKIAIDNAPQAVTVSFALIPGEQGSEHSGNIVYGSFGKHFYRTFDGINLTENTGKFLPDYDLIRIFSSVDGNRLTFKF